MQTPAYALRRVRDDEKELPENTTVSYQLPDQPSVDDSNIGNRDKKPPGDAPGTEHLARLGRAHRTDAGPGCGRSALGAPQVGALVSFWRWLFGERCARGRQGGRCTGATQRDRPAHRDDRHDRYRSSGDRDRNRDRGDRDRNRDIRRDGPRDPRRDGRPRGEKPRDNRQESNHASA